MQKFKNIAVIIFVWVLLWISQIIFSVLYNPQKDYHLWIWSWSWTNKITHTGYSLQQIIDFVTSKPTEFQTGFIKKYNAWCKYGKGECRAFIWQDMFTSYKWLDSIQYIGKDLDISKPSNITNRFDEITNLNPRRRYPYLFSQYIWPSTSKEYPNKDEMKLTRKNTILLWEQGISYSCDRKKIDKISQLNYQEFLQAIQEKNPEYWYPCNNDELAHALAFNYYHYLDDVKNSSLYYMVASFHDDTPSITLSMPAIIQWREGNNKISAFLWYDKLQKHYKELQKGDLEEDKRQKIELQIDMAIERTVSELSLHILTKASELSTKQKDPGSCIHSVSCLKNKWYISTVIKEIKNNCTKDSISCEILSIGQRSWWIKDSGTLTYPVNGTATYAWRAEKELRWVKVK